VYIKLSENKYLKILHAGESMEENRIERFEKVKGIHTLYFKTAEKDGYIKFANQILNQLEDIKNIQMPASESTDQLYLQPVQVNQSDVTSAYSDDITDAIQREIDEVILDTTDSVPTYTESPPSNSLTTFLNEGFLDGISSVFIESTTLFYLDSYSLVNNKPT
jgi:hypothetical protein